MEESLFCVVSTASRSHSLSGPLGVSGYLLLRMRKPGKVVTQSPSSLQLVPFKSEMSSEAGEMSSKPFLQNRCQTREGGLRGLAIRQKQSIWSKAVGQVQSELACPNKAMLRCPKKLPVLLLALYSFVKWRTPFTSDLLLGLM